MRRGTGWALVLAGAVLVVGSAASVVARGPAPPATLDDRVREVASTLRCPVCQELSVADSPSQLAAEMRATIRDMLRRGRTPAEVRAFFVRAYGEWILLSPPRRGLGVLAWVGPIAALLAGAAAAGLAVRRWRPRGSPPEVTPEERAILTRALAAAGGEDEG